MTRALFTERAPSQKATAPTSASFFGVDRSVDPNRLAGQRKNLASLPLEEVLIKMGTLAGREGGKMTHVFLSWQRWAELQMTMQARGILNLESIKVTPQVGFDAIRLVLGGGGFTGGVNGSTRIFSLFLDAAGAVSLLPGKIVDTAELAAGRVALEFPDAPKGVCPFGALRVAVTAGTTFTPGATDLSASGVTGTFYDLADIPASPLTA